MKLSGDITLLKEIMEGTKTFGDVSPNASKSRALKRVIGLNPRDSAIIPDDFILSNAIFSMALDSGSKSLAYHISDVDV